MILSVSERCDVVALYSLWFFNRIEEGFVDVRNPFYPKQVSRILLNTDNIDAIIFCTKDPRPILSHLDRLKDYVCMFQVTITPYRKDIEPAISNKKEVIEAVKVLSNRIGRQRVVVRFDPILINDVYTIDYHVEMFERLCIQIDGYVQRVIISFVDMKKNTKNNMDTLRIREFDNECINEIALRFGLIAKKYQLIVQTCAEDYDLSSYGITNEPCRSASMMYELIGSVTGLKKSTARDGCNCMASVDIGSYNCCSLFCKYCYANYDEKQVPINKKNHNPKSSLLIGELKEDDIIKIRTK